MSCRRVCIVGLPSFFSTANAQFLFGTQCFYRINRSRSLRWQDTGNESADAKSDDGAGEDERIPCFDLIELVRNQVAAEDRDRHADDQADEDLQERSAQDE